MAHALVHATDHDDVRRAGRERDVTDGGKAEREGDRHRRENHCADEEHEEDQQVEIAQRLQCRRQ